MLGRLLAVDCIVPLRPPLISRLLAGQSGQWHDLTALLPLRVMGEAESGRSRRRRWRAEEPRAITVVRRKLEMLNAVTLLADLAVPPSNRLEALKGDRRGQHSIRINDQWRLCFVWRDGDAYDVEVVDYH